MKVQLAPFGGVRPDGVEGIEVTFTHAGGKLDLVYSLRADMAQIVVPAGSSPARRDELWQHTCFEAFIAGPHGYREFNFSPAGDWAAYDFSAPRTGMRQAKVMAPDIKPNEVAEGVELHVSVALERDVTKMGLSAVIEAKDGSKSYWALKHPSPRPDFHHPDAFTLELMSLP